MDMSPATNTGERLRAPLEALDADGRRELVGRVLRDAESAGMWMEERDAGRDVPIALEPTPLDPAQFGYLHHASWQMRRALQRLPSIVTEDEAAAELLALSDEEVGWFEQFRSPLDTSTSRFCRIDALLDAGAPGAFPETLAFIEPNVVGLGGLCYAVDAAEILRADVYGDLGDELDQLPLQPADDPRRLLAAELADIRANLDTPEGAVALVGSRPGYETDGEDRRLVEWLNEESDLEVLFADPAELEVDDGGIVADGRTVGLVYRMMELSDLIERETEGAPLEGMRAAFERGIVVPTVGGDLEHKSVFELFTNERFAEHFTDRQRHIFDRHVVWTRLLSDRKTRSPQGRTVTLPTYARRERDRLVLKPNRSYGGTGVKLGCATSQREWERAVDEALAGEAEFVVQQLAPLVRRNLPVRSGDDFEFRDVHTVVGIFPSRYGCGLLGRYADDSVVNVSRSGGVVAYTLDFS